MFGFGLSENLVFVFVLAWIIVPIWLVFRLRRTRPNQAWIGGVLAVFTPVAHFYPRITGNWIYFILSIVLRLALYEMFGSKYAGLLAPVFDIPVVILRSGKAARSDTA